MYTYILYVYISLKRGGVLNVLKRWCVEWIESMYTSLFSIHTYVYIHTTTGVRLDKRPIYKRDPYTKETYIQKRPIYTTKRLGIEKKPIYTTRVSFQYVYTYTYSKMPQGLQRRARYL